MDMVVHSRESAAEGDDSGNVLGIRAAADDHRLVFRISGHFNVGPVQTLYQIGIGGIKQGLPDGGDLDAAAAVLQEGGTGSADLLFRCRHRRTQVQRAVDHAVLRFYDPVVHREFTPVVGHLQTDAGTVAGGPDALVVEVNKVILHAGFRQSAHGAAGGIHPRQRHAGMGGDASGVNPQNAVMTGHRAFRQFRSCEGSPQRLLIHSVGGDLRHAAAAHGVCHKSAVHGDNGGVFAAGEHGCAALFPMDAGEGAVRSKAAGNGFAVDGVVFHAFGAGFLCGPQQEPDALVQRTAGLRQALHGKQGGGHAALVVGDAPAVDAVVLSHHRKGVGLPAFSGRNHIQVGRDADDFIPLADLCPAAVVFHVAGAEAHLLRNGQGLRQRGGGTGTEGHTVLRGGADGIMADQTAKNLQHFLQFCIDHEIIPFRIGERNAVGTEHQSEDRVLSHMSVMRIVVAGMVIVKEAERMGNS